MRKQAGWRKLAAIGFAALAILTFLVTTGWNGVILANRWTLLTAVFTIAAALSASGKSETKKE